MTDRGMTRFSGRPATRLTILMTFHDHVGRKGLEMELLRRARKAGLAGLTVFEAHEGFGSSGRLHRSHLVSDDAPLALVVVDTSERIETFLESVSGLLEGVQVVLDDVDIVDL